MERFVFIAAVTIAILFGVAWAFGDRVFHFSFDEDWDGHGSRMAEIVSVAPGRMEAQTFSADRLRLRSVIGRVVITPEDRADFVIEIDNSGGRAPMPLVTTDDEGRVVIDGQLRGRINRCLDGGGAVLRGYDTVEAAQAPVITIRAPRMLNVSVSGASRAEIGATQVLEADFSGCGDATVADVAGPLTLDVSGAGDIQTGTAASLDVDVSGAADVTTGAIAGAADIDISGAGTVITGAIGAGADVDVSGAGSITFASLTGALTADGSGAGDITVQSGAITEANIDLAGAGDVEIAASIQNLDVTIVGAGDVDVANTVGNLDADISGVGNVSARAVTGTVSKHISGAGSVTIGT